MRRLTENSQPSEVDSWPEFDEYISKSPCKVTIGLGNGKIATGKGSADVMPHAHCNVHVPPFKRSPVQNLGKAAVLLKNSSRFLNCTVRAVPANPARDLSTNVGSLLTTVAGIGAPPLVAQAAVGTPEFSDSGLQTLSQRVRNLATQAEGLDKALHDAFTAFLNSQKKDWKYAFVNEDDAKKALADLKNKAQAFVDALGVLPNIESALAVLSGEITASEAAHPGLPDQPKLHSQLVRLKAYVELLKSHVAALHPERRRGNTGAFCAFQVVSDNNAPWLFRATTAPARR